MEADLYSPLPATAAVRTPVGLKRFVPRDLSFADDVVIPPPPPQETPVKRISLSSANGEEVAESKDQVDRRISVKSYVQALDDNDEDVEDVVVDSLMESSEDDHSPIVLTIANDVDAVARPAGRSFVSFPQQGNEQEPKDSTGAVKGTEEPVLQSDIDERATSGSLPNHSLRAIEERAFQKELAEHSSTTRKKAALAGAVKANRLATLFESVIFSPSSIQYASKWSPRDNDVVISSSIGSGDSLMERLVRALFAVERNTPLEQIVEQDTTAPWLECSLVAEDPAVLLRNQGGSVQGISRRVFRTTLSHSNLSMKINANKEARYIGLFRNPLHLRQAFMEQLKSFYVQAQTQLHPGTTEEVWATQFSRNVSFADIINTPVTLLQTTFHNAAKQYLEYEYNLRDWLENTQSERQQENRMIVFFEELAANPHQLIGDLATFLNIDVTTEQVQAIVETVCNASILGELSRTSSFICPASAEEVNSLEFAEFRQKLLTPPFAVSQRDALLLKARWKDVLVGRAESYEQLFERMTKSKYPKAKFLKSSRRSLATSIRAASSGTSVRSQDPATKRSSTYPNRRDNNSRAETSKYSASPRKSNLAKASTTSDETADDDDDDVDAKLSEEMVRSRTKSRRFTAFVGRLFS